MKIATAVSSRRLIKIASFLEKDYACSYPDHMVSGDVSWYKMQCLDQYHDNNAERTGEKKKKKDKSITPHRNVDSVTICLSYFG